MDVAHPAREDGPTGGPDGGRHIPVLRRVGLCHRCVLPFCHCAVRGPDHGPGGHPTCSSAAAHFDALRWRARTRDPGLGAFPTNRSGKVNTTRDIVTGRRQSSSRYSRVLSRPPFTDTSFALSSFPILLYFYFYFYFLVEQQRLTTRANSRRRFTCGVSLNPPCSPSFFLSRSPRLPALPTRGRGRC